LKYLANLGWALILTSPLCGAEPPLLLSDPKLPLLEIRPLDRHVWVLALDGEWKQSAIPGVSYHVNLLFPNGQSYSHRVLDDAAFRLGEVRCLVPEYQLVRNGLGRGGPFRIVISARRSVTTAQAPEVISALFTVRWPLNRPIQRWLPPSRFAPPEPIDAFRPPNQRAPAPGKSKIVPGEPPPVPR
jgi:hypothetical protein